MRPGRVQLEYVKSWTSSTSAIFTEDLGHYVEGPCDKYGGAKRRLQDIVAERRLRMAGHIIRMPPGRPANHTMLWAPRGSDDDDDDDDNE